MKANITTLLLLGFFLLCSFAHADEQWNIFERRPHPYTDVDDLIKYFDRSLDFTSEVQDHEFSNLFAQESPPRPHGVSRSDYAELLKESMAPGLAARRPVQKGSPARNQEILKELKEAGAVYWYEEPGTIPGCRVMTEDEKSAYQARIAQDNINTQRQTSGNTGILALRKPETYQSVSIDVGISAYQLLTGLFSPRADQRQSLMPRILCHSSYNLFDRRNPVKLERMVIVEGLYEYECVFEQSELDPVSRKLTHGQTPKNHFWKMACLTKQGDLGGF